MSRVGASNILKENYPSPSVCHQRWKNGNSVSVVWGFQGLQEPGVLHCE